MIKVIFTVEDGDQAEELIKLVIADGFIYQQIPFTIEVKDADDDASKNTG